MPSVDPTAIAAPSTHIVHSWRGHCDFALRKPGTRELTMRAIAVIVLVASRKSRYRKVISATHVSAFDSALKSSWPPDMETLGTVAPLRKYWKRSSPPAIWLHLRK